MPKWGRNQGFCVDLPPLKVLHLVTGLAQGGAERQLYLLLEGSDRVRFRPVVLVRHASARDVWTRPIRALDVPVIEIPGTCGTLRRFWRMWREVKRIGPDLIQGWTLWTNPQLAVLSRLAGVPVSVGSVRCNLYRSGRGALERWVTTRGLDCIVANSSKGERDLRKLGFPQGKIEVIYNAVRPEPEWERLDRESVRRRWNAEPHEVVLAAIGNLTPPKNYPLLIAAVRALRERRWPVKAVVFGEGLLRPVLEALVRSSGLEPHIRFCGQDPEARIWVGAADIFVLTSWGEGMANALLEGAMAGLPVVTTAVGGADDVVTEGETGHVVPVNDCDALVAAVERLLVDPLRRRVMGQRARERVLTEFSQARMVERFGALYERVWTRKYPAKASR